MTIKFGLTVNFEDDSELHLDGECTKLSSLGYAVARVIVDSLSVPPDARITSLVVTPVFPKGMVFRSRSVADELA